MKRMRSDTRSSFNCNVDSGLLKALKAVMGIVGDNNKNVFEQMIKWYLNEHKDTLKIYVKYLKKVKK